MAIDTLTEQEHYAALLETAPPEMREALTTECQVQEHWYAGLSDTTCFRCGQPLSAIGRVPLPLAEATVAEQEWWLTKPGRFVRYLRTEQGLMGIVGSHNERGYGTGADIFEAVAAALGA